MIILLCSIREPQHCCTAPLQGSEGAAEEGKSCVSAISCRHFLDLNLESTRLRFLPSFPSLHPHDLDATAMTGGSPQPKRLKRSSSGINEANDSSSSSSSASANQFSFSGVCDLNNKNNTTTTGISTTLPSASGSSSSLSTFWNLPQEIKDRIFTLACSLPSADVASLALASPIFHAQANAALWSNVRITRPSALTRLHDTIAARPELGVRVKNLHVGPEEEAPYREPHRWQPTANGPSSISTSLRTAKEGQLLPQWCAPGQEWRAEPPATDCCRSNAVFEALQEVQRSLKLELINNGFWRAHPSLPRVYEAQAALDLYLIHMRRIEDAEIHAAAKRPSCSHDGNCPPYPPLLIIGTAAQPEKPELGANDANQPYTLTRQQLLDHIDRRGGPQDSFDHPVIVARSDLNPASLRAPGASPTRWRPDSRYESDSFEFVSTSGSESLNYWQSGPPVRAFDSYSLRETLRKLLRQLPKLENLSLTGLLSYRCGTFGAGRGVVSPALKSFSMGPPPRIRRWYGDRLDFQRYKHIESLHLCGLFPAGEHIAKVGSLKRLQHFRWTLTDDLAEEELFR